MITITINTRDGKSILVNANSIEEIKLYETHRYTHGNDFQVSSVRCFVESIPQLMDHLEQKGFINFPLNGLDRWINRAEINSVTIS